MVWRPALKEDAAEAVPEYSGSETNILVSSDRPSSIVLYWSCIFGVTSLKVTSLRVTGVLTKKFFFSK